jgi:uncharacterized protein (TIGR03437 family)
MRLNVSTLAPRLATLAVAGLLAVPANPDTPNGISSPAYALLLDRATAPRSIFYIYQDADSPFNHGVPSGVFGVYTKVHLNAACIDDPAASNTTGCSKAAQAFDTNRGTVFAVSFDPLVSTDFAGVNFEEPTSFATRSDTRGYDLRGATRLVFDVRSPTPGGIRVQFGIAGQTSDFVLVPQSASYSSMSLPLSGIDLSSTHILFTIVTNAANAPAGGTVLVDNVRVDPLPTSLASAIGLPVTYQTFGVTPASSPVSTRVPVPPDQQLKNLAAVYDSSLLVLALLQRGSSPDLAAVRAVADALDSLLQHDNHGFPLPTAPDGSSGFHSGYEAGESTLFNDQAPPGQGLSGDGKLAGFSGGTVMCGPSAFCLVLNGGSSGANAAAALALIAAYRDLQDQRYLNDARQIGKWLLGMSAQGAGYGGYINGYDDTTSPPLTLNQGKSTETNSMIFACFTALADAEQELGNSAAAGQWSQAANTAGDFVMQMFNPLSGRFYAGAIPSNIAPGPGIVPGGNPKGNDVINSFDFLDANTLPVLTLATSTRYQSQIDWRLPVRWILQNYPRTIQAANQSYQGLGLVATTTSGPNGIAWEFTAQAVLAMRMVDRIYGETQFENSADLYLAQIRQNQTSAPFGDGRGLTAATLQNGDTLAPDDQCLSTPFQCIPARVALAPTAFAIFAELRISPWAIAARIAPGGICNAATFQPAPNNTLAPGTIFSIFGTSLADITANASVSGSSLPTVLRGTAVQVNGVCAPLFYVSPGQINAQVPDVPLSSQTVQVTVSTAISNNDCTNGNPTTPQTAPFAAASPGLFTLIGGTGTVVAQHSSDYSLVQSGSAAKTGEIVILYGTGFGPTTPSIPAGQIVNSTFQAANTLTVTIGNATLAPSDVLFAGLAPGFAGLWQLNLRIPAGIPPGDQPISITVAGASTQRGITIPIAP